MSSLPPFQTYSPGLLDAGVEPSPSPHSPGLTDAGVEPGPSQQGRLSSCVAHALAKVVCAAGWKNNPRINFLQEDAINQCIQLGGEKAVTEGSLPDYSVWRGKHILLKEDGVSAGAPGGSTYKAMFTKIEKCSSGDYDGEKLHVLVCWYGTQQNLRHCVYVTGKDGTSYAFWNSYGKQDDKEKIEVTKPGNQLYQVEVDIQELGAAPIALGATPIAQVDVDIQELGATPIDLGATPIAQGATPSSLGATPIALVATPSAQVGVDIQEPGATPIALTEEEKEDRFESMSEIMVAGVKKICAAQNGFDEMFAGDIGVKEDYQNWKHDHTGRMIEMKVKQILAFWALKNGPATPEKMYGKIVKMSKRKTCYIQIKEDLKKEFNFME